MNDHYMRLLTDVELNLNQKTIWYRLVETLLGADNNAQPENFIDRLTSHRDELEGDDEFPYVYVVYLSDNVLPKMAERIVKVWGNIYPRDFMIESSAEYGPECSDCQIEIDDGMYEAIQEAASKFLHNRWVESQVHEGWRYGLSANTSQKVSPRLRDWDSLHESYRRRLPMSRDQAIEFYKSYPYLFV